MARQRFKLNCVSHTIPTGKSLFGRREWLLRKFNSGDITPDELRELADLNVRALSVKRPQPKAVITMVFSRETTVSIEEFEQYYKPLNFKPIKYIY